jgi:hypothetical protein
MSTNYSPAEVEALIQSNAELLAALEELIDEAWQYDADAEEDDGCWTFSNSTRDRLCGAIAKAKGE